ncbi:alanine racemase [Streptomyces griseoincarnatus]|uniref:Alanine racemase n=3 Tax=Streptomyces TaxID=1883 RepID=A0ABP6JLE3_9ACTN|nr:MULTISPECIES: alanine racemase [Streptomyces]AXI88290.1 alanine racemase [Streptomyces sp. ETH9427]MQL61577.1 alanine racemase [Streptomyces vinaceus]GGP69830.1 alanine racemase [Streptomyces griseoincarnatus]MBU5943931.1 alanine racemase [Streptomyces sp. PAM3C]MDH3037292.1 alanine racemase [Streptomyces sp. TRM75561]
MKETADPHGAQLRARAVIDLAAVRANVRTLRERAPRAALMAVVKADGYGHGAAPCARAAVEAGATWLGAATPQEALALREPGSGVPDDVRVMCWLWTPGGPWREAVEADIDVSVSGFWALDEVVAAARAAGRPARVQLKADTGLGRGGCQPADWAELVAGALRAEAEGLLKVTGLWSHFACADEPGHPSIAAQLLTFREMVAYAEAQGVEPEVRHIANSPATLTLPESHFDLVRPGIAMYGVSPSPEIGTPMELGLRPAMTLTASLALVKNVPGGHGVSYGHHYVTAGATTLGLVPLGYADGIPRHASGGGPVLVEGKWRTVAGRVAMDQFVVDLGGDEPGEGAEAVLFGPGDRGEPTAEDWAQASGTIAYEIVTRIGSRVPRLYVNGEQSG